MSDPMEDIVEEEEAPPTIVVSIQGREKRQSPVTAEERKGPAAITAETKTEDAALQQEKEAYAAVVQNLTGEKQYNYEVQIMANFEKMASPEFRASRLATRDKLQMKLDDLLGVATQSAEAEQLVKDEVHTLRSAVTGIINQIGRWAMHAETYKRYKDRHDRYNKKALVLLYDYVLAKRSAQHINAILAAKSREELDELVQVSKHSHEDALRLIRKQRETPFFHLD